VFEGYKGKSCLVTGGTGMLGRQVVDLLRAAGARVMSASLDGMKLWDDVLHVKLDLRWRKETGMLVRSTHPDVVFHLAGIKSNPTVTRERPLSFFLPMAELNLSVLGACAEAGVKALVYTSSVGAYARGGMSEAQWSACRPQDGYPGLAKRIGEWTCEAAELERGLEWAVIRLSNTYGPGDDFDPETAMVVPALMAKALRGDDPVMVMGNGTAVRDFLWAGDAARAVLMAGLDCRAWARVNVGGGVGHSVDDLAAGLAGVTRSRFKFERFGGQKEAVRVLPIVKAQALGWEPEVSLPDGLARTWAWLKDHPDEARVNLLKEGR